MNISKNNITKLDWRCGSDYKDIPVYAHIKNNDAKAVKEFFENNVLEQKYLNMLLCLSCTGLTIYDDQYGHDGKSHDYVQRTTEITETLISYGADIDGLSSDGTSPMIIAIQYGQHEIGEFLISKNNNIKNNDNLTEMAFDIACCSDNPKFVKMMLDKGADPNLKNKGQKRLFKTMGMNHMYKEASEEIADILVKAGVDPYKKDTTKLGSGLSPHYVAINEKFVSKKFIKNLENYKDNSITK